MLSLGGPTLKKILPCNLSLLGSMLRLGPDLVLFSISPVKIRLIIGTIYVTLHRVPLTKQTPMQNKDGQKERERERKKNCEKIGRGGLTD